MITGRHLVLFLLLLVACRNELPIGELGDGGVWSPGTDDAGRAVTLATIGLDCTIPAGLAIQQTSRFVAVWNGIGRSSSGARFETGFCPGAAYKSYCHQTIGTCQVVVKELSPAQPGAPCNIMSRSAGNITVSGGTHPVTLVPSYEYQDSPMPLWNGGETLRFDATGAQIPAFSAMLVAPNRITLTNGLVVVDRNQDLSLVWSGGGSGRIYLTASANVGLATVLLTCDLEAAAGRGTIPAALLSRFPAGAEAATSILVRETASARAGTFDVSVLASDVVLGSDGQMLPAKLTFR